MRHFRVCLMALALAGCVGFLPSYDQSVHRQLVIANDEIGKIGAALEPDYSPQPPFEEFEPYYISAFASLNAAEDRATGRVRDYRGSVPARAASTIQRAIANCRASLRNVLDQHRATGLDRNRFELNAVVETCSIPATMEARLDR